MLTIKKIEKAEKSRGKIRVYLDNGIHLLLYYGERAELKSAGISMEEDAEISEEQYTLILKEMVGKRAKKRAMHLLEQMDRSEYQLRQKLAQGEYPQECIDDAILYVKKYHYLDDRRYACHFIRYAKENFSRRQLEDRLVRKGISRRDVKDALDQEYPEDESDRMEMQQIQKLLQKRRFDPQISDEKEKQRTYAYLMRRGFSSGKILRMMETG